jgi:hypothetical protein
MSTTKDKVYTLFWQTAVAIGGVPIFTFFNIPNPTGLNIALKHIKLHSVFTNLVSGEQFNNHTITTQRVILGIIPLQTPGHFVQITGGLAVPNFGVTQWYNECDILFDRSFVINGVWGFSVAFQNFDIGAMTHEVSLIIETSEL